MNRTRFAMAAFVASAFAAVALGQNADKNSAGPTKNDYRLRVVEPRRGSTITGSTVRVVVNTEIPADVGDERRDVNSMPRPDVDVFLDGDLKGTMRDANNVLEVDSVNAGPHKLILLAKNRANEIIDRKVIKFSSAPAVASTTTTSSDTTRRSDVDRRRMDADGKARDPDRGRRAAARAQAGARRGRACQAGVEPAAGAAGRPATRRPRGRSRIRRPPIRPSRSSVPASCWRDSCFGAFSRHSWLEGNAFRVCGTHSLRISTPQRRSPRAPVPACPCRLVGSAAPIESTAQK